MYNAYMLRLLAQAREDDLRREFERRGQVRRQRRRAPDLGYALFAPLRRLGRRRSRRAPAMRVVRSSF